MAEVAKDVSITVTLEDLETSAARALSYRPKWIKDLDPQMALNLAPIMGRPSMNRLMSKDARAVQAILKGPDKELAMDIIRYNPFSTVA